MTLERSQFLRRVLWVDALASLPVSALVLVGATGLETLLGLPESLLRAAAFILLPFSALALSAAVRVPLNRGLVWAVIATNVLWFAESLVLLFAGGLQPTPLGKAIILLQALWVAAMATLEYLGLKRTADP